MSSIGFKKNNGKMVEDVVEGLASQVWEEQIQMTFSGGSFVARRSVVLRQDRR